MRSQALTFCNFGGCRNLVRRSLVGLTRSDFGLLRQKKAIGEDSSILAAVYTINKLRVILCLNAQDLNVISDAYPMLESHLFSSIISEIIEWLVQKRKENEQHRGT